MKLLDRRAAAPTPTSMDELDPVEVADQLAGIVDAVQADDAEALDGLAAGRRAALLRRLRRFDDDALTWMGVVCGAVGIALLFVGWGRVAGETEVHLQLPYLVSAVFTGVALVVLGVAVVAVAAANRDVRAHKQQVDRMVRAVEGVQAALERRTERGR